MKKWIEIDGNREAREVEGPATYNYASPDGRRYVIEIFREIGMESREMAWTNRVRERLANGETPFPNYRELFENEADAMNDALEEITDREALERESHGFEPQSPSEAEQQE